MTQTQDQAEVIAEGIFIRYSFGKRSERVQPPPTYDAVLHFHLRYKAYVEFCNSWGTGKP